MSTIAARLEELGLALPAAPKPVASYIPAVRSGGLLFISGQLPFRDGSLMATGPVPGSTSIEDAQAAARQCVLNGLAVAAAELAAGTGGGAAALDRIRRVIRLGVFVCCEPGFGEQPKVANGASDLMQQIFGENGRHARAAVGSIALPLAASVEVEMLLEVE